jgi:hypothetical protein
MASGSGKRPGRQIKKQSQEAIDHVGRTQENCLYCWVIFYNALNGWRSLD